MNCFNHTDRAAVAQCSQCGKFLCKECASHRTPIICDECVNAMQQNYEAQVQAEVEKKEASEKTLFTISAVFAIIDIVFTLIPSLLSLNITLIIFSAIGTVLWSGLPFGWARLSELRNKMNVILVLPLLGWAIYFIVKYTIAFFTGWIWLIKAIIRKMKKA